MSELTDYKRRIEAPRLAAHKEQVAALTARITALEAALEGAEEALKPFAEQSKRFDNKADDMGFARSFNEHKALTEFRHGELRAACSAYEAIRSLAQQERPAEGER